MEHILHMSGEEKRQLEQDPGIRVLDFRRKNYRSSANRYMVWFEAVNDES